MAATLDGDADSPTTAVVLPSSDDAADLMSVAAPTTLLLVRDGARQAQVQACSLDRAILVRLLARDAQGRERVSAWSAAQPGATLQLLATRDADQHPVLALDGAASLLVLP